MYKLFLTLRYLRSRKIAYFAMAAVTLCVAMVLIVMSVMGGWLDQLMWRAKGLLGDVIIENRSYTGFPMYQELIDEISNWPEIEQATPVIHTLGMLRFPEQQPLTRTVSIIGLKLDEAMDVTDLRKGLFYESHYPGTTELGLARQPLLGVSPVASKLPSGEEVHIPTLPEPFQAALQKSRTDQAASGRSGPLDTKSLTSRLNEFMADVGGPDFPGVWEFVTTTPGFIGEPLPGIIIGRDIVAQRQSDGRYKRFEWLPKGTKFSLTLWATSETGMVDVTPTIDYFRYVDDSRTGVYDIDANYVYVEFEYLQRLLRMDEGERADDSGGKIAARCSQIQIKVAPNIGPLELKKLTARIQASYNRLSQDPAAGLDLDELRMANLVEVKTWQESQAHLIGPVQKEKFLVTMLFGIISLVAVALILCILYMIVLQKTRDIGIIKSIGGSASGVASIFVLYGAFVGLVGAIFGTGLGYLFVTNINEIQDWLISLNPSWRVWDLQVYSFDRIPDQMKISDAIVVCLIGIAASTIGSLVAAWRAGTMHPVEALRHE